MSKPAWKAVAAALILGCTVAIRYAGAPKVPSSRIDNNAHGMLTLGSASYSQTFGSASGSCSYLEDYRRSKANGWWKNYNCYLRDRAYLQIRATSHVMKGSERISRYGNTPFNFVLAREVNERLERSLREYQMTASTVIWNYDQPDYFSAVVVEGTGFVAYDTCSVLPFVGGTRLNHKAVPCREGGALAGLYPPSADLVDPRPSKVKVDPASPRKCVMVFYSPAQPLYTASMNPLQVIPVMRDLRARYLEALQACYSQAWGLPYNLTEIGLGLIDAFRVRAGFSGLRGVAVVPNPLTADVDAGWGIHSPTGHVLVEAVKLSRFNDTNEEPLLPDLPLEHNELWIVSNAPVYYAILP